MRVFSFPQLHFALLKAFQRVIEYAMGSGRDQ